ncbi:MAG: lumenal Hsp70 protein [Piccolia ochrophora]|nr:MAG: lumenal Hsp70 protein [Piccolia ochrophora]
MAPPGRRRFVSTASLALCLLFLFVSTASAASAVLGIDLGTEYIKAALVKPGIPLEIVLTKDSKRKESSAVAFKPLHNAKSSAFPERLYGSDAMALAGRFPADVYPNLKPLLGELLAESGRVEAYSQRYPALVMSPLASRGTAAFTSKAFPEDTDSFSVEELLAMELQNVRANAEAMAGKGSSIRDAVITIPAFYTASERQAIELAADLAGLRVLALMSDGLAVGLNYATARTFPTISEGEKPERHLVFDMGAGSTTATVLQFQGKTVKDVGRFNKTVQDVSVLGTGWDRVLGGDALNQIIVDRLVEEFVNSPKVKTLGFKAGDVVAHGRAAAKLWKEAERIRQVLSANSETTASFEGLYEDVDFRYKLSRADFEKMASSFANRIAEPIERALAMAKLSIKDLDTIVLHGGMSRTPFVQKQLERLLGDPAKLRSNVNADESAVFGAAFKGASLSPSFRVKEIRAGEISGYAMGLQWQSEEKERQQKLFVPTSLVGAEKSVPFKNLKDFSFSLHQLIPSVDGSGEEGVQQISKVTTQNLTASVAQLSENFGCATADIQTRFSIKLSAMDGLPEAVRGSVSCEVDDSEKKGGVVDDVKGFFGFGSNAKKGEQDVLADEKDEKDDFEPSSSSEKSSSSTSSSSSKSAKASDDASSEAEKDKKPKKRTESIYLSFSTEGESLPPVSASELKRMKERLSAFDDSDKARRLREEALNNLEAYTYRVRDLLEDESFMDAASEAEKKDLKKKQQATGDWLVGDGASAPRADLRTWLKDLKAVVEPIERRKIEESRRPTQISVLTEALDQTKSLLDMIKEQYRQAEEVASAASSSSLSSVADAETQTTAAPSVDDFADLEDSTSESSSTTSVPPVKIPQGPAYTQEEVDSVSSIWESTDTWLKAKVEEQEKLSRYDNPVLLSTDLDKRAKELRAAVMSLVQKKARPPPKAKSTAKAKKAKKAKSTGSKTTSSSATGTEEDSTYTVSETPVREEGQERMTDEQLREAVNRAMEDDRKKAGKKAKSKASPHDEL